jgi:branched-chain amino acid transport system substrate-binding protein
MRAVSWSDLLRMRSLALCAVMLCLFFAPPVRAADEPYNFYAIVSLTGQSAFIGHANQVAMGAIEQMINRTGGIAGRPLHFIIEDDQSSPAVAVQLANQLFVKGVPAILGPDSAGTCVALLPMVSNGPIMYCMANAIHPPNGSYAFSANLSTKDYTAAGFRYLQAKGVRKLALLTSTDASGQDGEEVALENLKLPEFKNLQLVANEHFAPADLSVSAQMARIKASGAQAMDAWTTGTPFGTVLRGVQEAGWDGTVMTNAGNINKIQMQQYAQFIPQKLIFTGAPYLNAINVSPRVLAQRSRFLAAMGDAGVPNPDNTTITAWDPLLIMIGGIRQIGPGATAAQLRDYMLKLHDFAGVQGMYDFRRGDQHGIDPLSSPMVRYDKASGDFPAISKPGGLPL